MFKFRILGRVIDVTTIVAGIAVVLMMCQIAIDVVAKYVFSVPLPGTITFVSSYYMVVVAFLPLAFTERSNRHISVEVLTVLFPARVQRVLNVFAMVFCTLVFAALTWQGWIEAGRAMEVGTFEIEQNRKLLTWPARYVLPIGCGLITLTLLAKIWVALVKRPPQSIDEPFF